MLSQEGELGSPLSGDSDAEVSLEHLLNDSSQHSATDEEDPLEGGPLPAYFVVPSEDGDSGLMKGGKGHFGVDSDDGLGLEGSEAAWMLNMWSLPNLAVVLSYFCVGFAMSFLRAPMSYYVVNVLDAPPNQQLVLANVTSLPWSFKLLFGFISDNFTINSQRRKPYFIFGWMLYICTSMSLAVVPKLTIGWLASLQFFGTCGYVLSDVTTDAIIVERSKHESEEDRGTMQATGYISRGFGSLLGAFLGMLLYNKDRWGWGLNIDQIFLVSGLFPFICLAPFVYFLYEAPTRRPPQSKLELLQQSAQDIFSTLSLKAVYIPMAVVFTYNAFQIPNGAWRSFMIDGLGFSNFALGLIGLMGTLFSSAGLVVYRTFFFKSSWRGIYFWTTLVVVVFSVLQLLLIFRINLLLRISDLVFALGDDVLAEFVMAIQFLPICTMYISMCPDGAEGTTYAIITTFSNVAFSVSTNIGMLLTRIWDVSNAAITAGDYAGLWKLTLLTSLLQPVPLLLLRYMPADKTEHRLMIQKGSDWRGGAVFVAVLATSITWTVVASVYEIIAGA
ncbi:unnamed protein product [Chrysoparadoxa australica]